MMRVLIPMSLISSVAAMQLGSVRRTNDKVYAAGQVEPVAVDPVVEGDVVVERHGSILDDIVDDVVKDIEADMSETVANVATAPADPLASASVSMEVADPSDCSDLTGKYTNTKGQAVTVSQDGCALMAMFDDVNGPVQKEGQVMGGDIYMKDFDKAGKVNVVGDVLFGGGSQWTKVAQDADFGVTSDPVPVEEAPVVAAVNTSVNESDVAMNVSDEEPVEEPVSAVEEPCQHVGGSYQTAEGTVVTMAQTGCDLLVMLKLKAGEDEVVKTGSVDGIFVKVDGMALVGALSGDNVQFLGGPAWKKLNTSSIPSECDDVSGYYSVRAGKTGFIEQAGCHMQVHIFDAETQQTVMKLGTLTPHGVVDGHMTLFNWNNADAHGTRERGGALVFDNGMRWGKLSEMAVEAINQENCSNVSGHYRDSQGKVVSMSQDKCKLSVQMDWEGNITKAGFVFGKAVHIKDFQSMGRVDDDEGNLYWFDGTFWTKLNSAELAQLGVPEAGCMDFTGLYKDEEGKPVHVNQTECKANVSFWLDSKQRNVVSQGHISHNTLHLQNFVKDAILLGTGIHFGDVLTWEKVENKTEALFNITYGDSTPDVMVESAPMEAVDEVPEECDSFGGLYLDGTGHDVDVKQTKCDLAVEMWVDSLNTTITRSGHVYNQSVAIEDFGAQLGVRTDTGVKFGDLADWILADNGDALFDDLLNADNLVYQAEKARVNGSNSVLMR